MSTINETLRVSDVLLFEDGEQYNYVRDAITVASGTPASVIGQVMGKITASGKYVQVNPAAADGSQNAAAVLLAAVNASAADATCVAVTRGPAILKVNGLSWTSGMTTNQKNAALAQLTALGITNRTDYGV